MISAVKKNGASTHLEHLCQLDIDCSLNSVAIALSEASAETPASGINGNRDKHIFIYFFFDNILIELFFLF